MKTRVSILILFILILITANYIRLSDFQISKVKDMVAGVFFVDSVSTSELRSKYLTSNDREKINILLVAGHDDKHYGTEFKGLKEVELTTDITNHLYDLLKDNERFNVFRTRDTNGYTNEFARYIETQKDSILEFRSKNMDIMNALTNNNVIERIDGQITHNRAPSDTILVLYGVNKWANENNIDIVIHSHFNDHAGRKYNQYGKYSGFSIYIPEKQYSNAKASKSLANSVFNQLNKIAPNSDIKGERSGIIETQDLIAIGSNNTLDPAVLLIEYGYIYENQFFNENIRPIALREYAFQTYLGIMNYLDVNFSKKNINNTATLPYVWNKNLYKGIKNDQDVFALQLHMALNGTYPPIGTTKNDCPMSGNFGNCTKKGLIEYQKINNLNPNGIVDINTRNTLNSIF